jgi:hypothetical protein
MTMQFFAPLIIRHKIPTTVVYIFYFYKNKKLYCR